MLNIIIFSILGAFLSPFIHKTGKRFATALIVLIPFGVFAAFCTYLPEIAVGNIFSTTMNWSVDLNVQLAFRMDGLSLLFALIISGIGTLVIYYATGYMKGHEQYGRFIMFLLLFMSSMLGLVLSDNIISLFVFWELTSITSFLLIGFDTHKEDSRSAALQALLVTGGGGLALLGGLILLGQAGNSYTVSELVGNGSGILIHPLAVPALLLILVGAFTKSAQFPFHFWLPNAMAAPSPVSAYLHSATMVKAGIYLLARLYPVFSPSPWWQTLVPIFGLLTMLAGSILAYKSTDLKRILAYSTVSSLGVMTMLLGLGITDAVIAALIFLFAHALYKGALFMIAGAIDHETGIRDVTRLGGLIKSMPLLAGITALAGISFAGFGPLISFIGKELMFEALLHAPAYRVGLLTITVLTSAVFVALALIVFIKPFLGKPKAPEGHDHQSHGLSVSLWLGPAILALLGLIFGLLPEGLTMYLAQPAVSAVLNESLKLKLSLWHGLNPALGFSVLAVVLGIFLFWGWNSWRKVGEKLTGLIPWGPESGYQKSIDLLNWVAGWQTKILQNGQLRNYLLVIIISSIALLGTLLWMQGEFLWPDQLEPLGLYEASLAVLIVIAAFAAVRSKSRLGAITAMGVVGYSVALIFLRYGAPDLAMTQFLIESITVVLFVFAFYHLPKYEPVSSVRSRVFQAGVAALTGLLMTGLVISVLQVDLFPSISTYFMENAVSMAHGRNIVNVILVDFRGLDTLGEITVLAVAGTGVFAVLKYRRRRENR